eukprot:SAG22_NODE_1249_length_5012_cov_1.781396_4_plen_92_part_00
MPFHAVLHKGARKAISIAHRGPVVAVQESPFMEGVYLTVGDWTFAIWKVGVAEPLFQSPYSEYLLLDLVLAAQRLPARLGRLDVGDHDRGW